MSSFLLSKTIEDKRYLWLERTNQYVVLEQEAFTVAEKLIKGETPKTIATHLETTLSVPFEAALKFIKELEDQILNSSTKGQEKSINCLSKITIPSDFEITTTYQVNNTLIKVSYKSDVEASYIHPKFAHLETDKLKKGTDFKVFINHDKIYLVINNKVRYGWSKEEIHYFQGKFSMEFIQAMYHKEESEWMGVFHASAVSNQQKAVLFLGDSGNIFFPKLDFYKDQIYFKDIALDFLKEEGFEPIYMNSEKEAKEYDIESNLGKYPIYFFNTDTSGEKTYEEFYTEEEDYNIKKYDSLGFINTPKVQISFDDVEASFESVFSNSNSGKLDIIKVIKKYVPDFMHIETGKHLDQKM